MIKRSLYTLTATVGFLFLTISVAHAASNAREPEVKIFDGAKTTLENSFLAFSEDFRGGATVALGDMDGNGTDEILVGAGPGGGPQVRVFQSGGTLLGQFSAYQEQFRGGVNVASCDFDNDSIDEILVGPGQGSRPLVRILSSTGGEKFTPGFLAFSKDFRGGVNVACGDVDGDGYADVVTGVGVGASPKVRVFDRYGTSKNLDITPYADRDRGGVSVAVGNVDGGAESEVITGIYRFGRSLVKVYKANSARTIVGKFEGWHERVQGGFHVAAGDLDADNRDEVLVGVALGGGPHIRAFEAYGKALPQNFFAYEKDFRGGSYFAAGDIDGDGNVEIVAAPGRNAIKGRADLQKYIEVRLDEQRLYAYENGLIARTFLVSTGIPKYPTPEGAFSVLAKIPKKDYEWSYGPNHPDNYDIKDVKWNLRFAPTFYLHYAFWHNDFGRRRSHGCVNINRENSEWLYNWADVGTPVIIRK